MTQYFDDMCMLGEEENTLWFHIVISSSHEIICGFQTMTFMLSTIWYYILNEEN